MEFLVMKTRVVYRLKAFQVVLPLPDVCNSPWTRRLLCESFWGCVQYKGTCYPLEMHLSTLEPLPADSQGSSKIKVIQSRGWNDAQGTSQTENKMMSKILACASDCFYL